VPVLRLARWVAATHPALRHVVQRGAVGTDASRDHTVKVDVWGLHPGTGAVPLLGPG